MPSPITWFMGRGCVRCTADRLGDCCAASRVPPGFTGRVVPLPARPAPVISDEAGPGRSRLRGTTLL